VGHLHGGTASGVRSQNREIKYKNPLSSLRRKAPWPRSRTVRRLAMRASGRLKTFGLVFALPFVERPPLEEGGGTINPWRLWAALPPGVSRRDFFSWRWRFDYFSDIKQFQTFAHSLSVRAASVFKRLRQACVRLGLPAAKPCVFIFGRRGAIKSAEFSHRDRWTPSHEWPQNSAKLFLDGAPGTIKGLLARVAATHQPAGRRREVGHPRRR
jgi:hypothetical protein